MHYFYILRCNDNSLYCGITNNLDLRVKKHNESKLGAKYTRSRLPVTLVYSEKYKTKSEALKREYEVKQWNKKEKEKLVTSAG
jgi:putative endonuclease